MRRTRFAVVGCGTVSGYGHLPAIEALRSEGAELAAVVDVDGERLRQVSRQYPGAKAFNDYRDMLRRGETDAVVVATLLDTHASIARDALRAGKHVLVEKPPAKDLAGCARLIKEAEKARRICAVNFDLRYQRSFSDLRKYCRKGVIGRLRAIRVIFDWCGASHRNPRSDREERLMRDGTIMFGEGIHFVDMARWITGSEFGRAFCVGTNIQGHAHLDHMVLASVMRNGVVVNIESSHGYGFSSKDPAIDRQMDLIGEAGVIKWSAEKRQTTVYGKRKTVELDAPDQKEFAPLYRDLLRSIRRGTAVGNLPTILDGYEALKVVSEADRCAGEGKAARMSR